MCWTTKKPPIKRVAEEDIKCIKFGDLGKDGKIISPFYDFRYAIGQEYRIEEELHPNLIIPKSIWRIDEGFHSYDPKKISLRIIDNSKLLICKGNWKIENVYELSVGRIRAIDCIIPKGSTYYINGDGEIVSDCIKVIGIRKIERWSGFMAWLKLKLLYSWRIL